MSGALEPVEDVGAAGVVHLVEGVSVRLLHGDGVAAETHTGQRWTRFQVKEGGTATESQLHGKTAVPRQRRARLTCSVRLRQLPR